VINLLAQCSSYIFFNICQAFQGKIFLKYLLRFGLHLLEFDGCSGGIFFRISSFMFHRKIKSYRFGMA